MWKIVMMVEGNLSGGNYSAFIDLDPLNHIMNRGIALSRPMTF